jgi:hypothetical protein
VIMHNKTSAEVFLFAVDHKQKGGQL